MRRLKFAIAAAAIALTLTMGVFPAAAHALPLPPNGFTAKVVAHSNQVITGHINAAGYDIGIYVGPGVHNVKVNRVTVSGANDEGILVQRASNIVIENSAITGNGISAYAGLTEVKAIVLAGAKNCLVKGNVIKNNLHGGVSVLDDGPSIIFAPTAVSTSPAAGTWNLITANLIKDNQGDCGIVLSAKNPGGGVSHNVASWNTVLGSNPAGGDSIPGVGGIVVAGGAFGPVQLLDNIILNNVVTGGFISGISLHAFGPAVITGTELIGNKLTNNGAGELSKDTTGIEIFAVPSVGTISGTQVLNDTISKAQFGVWHANDTGTHIAHLRTIGVTVPVFP
jgi:Right handed beta helix region